MDEEREIAASSYDFRKVSVTALIPAFGRGEYSDIPWAKEMLRFLRARGLTPEGGPWSERAAQNYAAFFEARFKSVNRILEDHGATQVLELAAGLSPRGMDFAQRGVVYVEADLAESSEFKREVVTAVCGEIPQNLHLCAASVIDNAQFRACCAVFEDGPVTVATEGLLRYLTFDEKKHLCANVRELLRRNGGFWVTTDIHLRHWAHGHRRLANRQRETEQLGRDLDPNYFDDLDHAQSFFEECGFAVDSRPLLEGIRERVITLSMAPDDLLIELNERRTFVLTV
jgi:O-methyltransferase involved in polyketide biosynthesis